MKNLNYFRYIILPSLIAVLLIAYSCKENVTTPNEQGNIFSGQILDEQDIAVPGAIIQVFTSGGIQGLIDKDTTDDEGNFELSGVPNDFKNLSMRIDHEDFKAFESKVSDIVDGKDKKKLAVKLEHDSECTGVIIVTSIDNNENPLANVEIRLTKEGRKIRAAKTNENGSFVFENVCPGHYGIRLAKDAFRVIEEDINIEQGDTIPKSYKLLSMGDDTCCKGVIFFNVKDSVDNPPVHGVSVILWRGSDKVKILTTGEDGSVKFENICDGEYQISFSKDGYFGQEFNFVMDCNDSLEFNKQIVKRTCCDGIIYITVKDSVTGEGIPNAQAKVWLGDKLIKDPKSNELGLITITGVCEGKYGISLHRENYLPIEFNVVIGCNETIELTKRLLQKEKDTCCEGSIEVNIVDKETKDMINGATIKLWFAGKLQTKKISENGKVKFEDICTGVYLIDVIHDKYKTINFEVNVSCNEQVKLNKELEKYHDNDSCCDGVVIVAPKDIETNKIISGTRVKLWSGDKLVYQETVHGEPLIIKDLCEGKYQFSFNAEGYYVAEEDFVIACNDTMEFPFYLKKIDKDSCCHGLITIRPYDNDTKLPVTSFTLKIWKGDKLLAEKKVTDSVYTFMELCNGKYSFDIFTEHYVHQEFAVELGCNENKNIERFLVKSGDGCCDGQITIVPKQDDSDIILNGATVKIWKGGQLLATKKVEGNSVVFSDLCEGKYSFSITIEGYKGIEFAVELGCNEVKNMEKGLIKSSECCDGIVVINVVDKNNNALSNVTTNLWRNDSKVRTGKTNDDGSINFYELCEGKYAISFSKDGYSTKEDHFEISCHDTLYKTYTLENHQYDTCETASIYLVVKDKESGAKIAGATVKVYNLEGQVIAEGTTNDEGVYTKSNLKAPGKYKFWSHAEGYGDSHTIVEWTSCVAKEGVVFLSR